MEEGKISLKGHYGFWVAFLVFCLLNLFDLVTTLMNWGLIQAVESNPLFLLTKNFLLVVVTKISLCILVGYSYYRIAKTPGHAHHRFGIIAICVCAIPALIMASISALAWHEDTNDLSSDEMVELAENITMQLPASEKAKMYFKFVFFLDFMPYLVTIVTFYLWRWNEKVYIDG